MLSETFLMMNFKKMYMSSKGYEQLPKKRVIKFGEYQRLPSEPKEKMIKVGESPDKKTNSLKKMLPKGWVKFD